MTNNSSLSLDIKKVIPISFLTKLQGEENTSTIQDTSKTLAILYYNYYVLHIIIHYIIYIYIFIDHTIYGKPWGRT